MSEIQWTKNAHNLGKDLLFVLLWIASWSLVDMAVEHLSQNEKSNKIKIYITLFMISFIAMMLLGNAYVD